MLLCMKSHTHPLRMPIIVHSILGHAVSRCHQAFEILSLVPSAEGSPSKSSRRDGEAAGLSLKALVPCANGEKATASGGTGLKGLDTSSCSFCSLSEAWMACCSCKHRQMFSSPDALSC